MKDRVKERWKAYDGAYVFISMFIVAFAVYIYYLVLEPINSDTYCEGLLTYPVFRSDVSLGRWMTPYCAALTGYIVFPTLYLGGYFLCNVLLTLFLIDVWEIKGRKYRCLTGTIITVTPAIVGQTMYIYEMMTYIICMLCIVLSLYLTIKRKGKLSLSIAAVLFSVSLGAFQANIGLVIFIILGYLLIWLLKDNNDSFKNFAEITVRSIVYGVAGVSLYWALMMLHLKLYGLDRPTYAGADRIGVVNSFVNAISHIRRPYRLFLSYYTDVNLFGGPLWGILALPALIYIFLAIRQLIHSHKFWKVAMIIIILALLPPGAEVMDIIAPEHGMQLYWTYQMQLFAPLCIGIVCTTSDIQDKWNPVVNKVAVTASYIGLFGLVLTYSLCAYSSFRTLDIGSRHIKLYVKNAVSRAIEDENYQEGMPIVFLGFVNDDPVQEKNPLRKYSYYERAYPFWKDRYEVFSVWPKYCWYNFGIDIGEVTPEQHDKIIASDKFKTMDQYPSNKAYAIIDGCYVILMDRDSVK